MADPADDDTNGDSTVLDPQQPNPDWFKQIQDRLADKLAPPPGTQTPPLAQPETPDHS